MSQFAKDIIRRLALSTYSDPTATDRERKLARGVLLLVDGRLP